ncbi:hypothetical protein CLV62_11441 [Dysgonomonas alginatilytica]|uniref:Uncharacterized protein n=2 Tax=Dysgonomonas alginatilytica TaxID=1605892 RepID=A0A2V3PQ99_9BACT|nr:hypothetical protein CLV62_11441 [Dysgonomonas alginatilytica]
MPEQITEIIIIARYILIALAIVGVIVLAFGIYHRNKKLIGRGAYLIILSIVVSVCGYVIYEKTKQRTYQMLQNTYITY